MTYSMSRSDILYHFLIIIMLIRPLDWNDLTLNHLAEIFKKSASR
jgi:hypothetical protein